MLSESRELLMLFDVIFGGGTKRYFRPSIFLFGAIASSPSMNASACLRCVTDVVTAVSCSITTGLVDRRQQISCDGPDRTSP